MGELMSVCVFKTIMTSLVLFVLSSIKLVEPSLDEQQHIGGPLLHLFLETHHTTLYFHQGLGEGGGALCVLPNVFGLVSQKGHLPVADLSLW